MKVYVQPVSAGGRPRSLTEAQVADALQRVAKGVRLKQIAADYQVHRNTLYKAVREQRKPKK